MMNFLRGSVFLRAIHFGMARNMLKPSSADAGELTVLYSSAPGSKQEEYSSPLNIYNEAFSLLLFTIYLILHIIQLSVFLLKFLAFLLEFYQGRNKKLVKITFLELGYARYSVQHFV